MTKIAFFFFIFLSISKALLADAPPVILKDGKDIYEIGLNLDILEDPSGKLNIDDVSSSEWSGKFKKNNKKIPNLGFSKSSFWARFTIENRKKNHDMYLTQNYFLQDHIEFYQKEKMNWKVKTTGDLYSFDTREIDSRLFIFKISPKGKSTYFVKIKGSTNQFNLSLYSPLAFASKETKSNYIMGLFFGLALTMILYNFFIFLITKSVSYFNYTFYVLFYALFFGSLQGLSQQFIFPSTPWFYNNGIALWAGLAELFICFFTMTFLNLRKHSKFLYRIFIFLCTTSFFIFLSSPFIEYALSVRLYIINIFAIGPIIIISGFYCAYQKKYRPAKYFVLALSFMIIGILITGASYAAFLPNNMVTEYAGIFGSAMELILFSMGLADRFNYQQQQALIKEKDFTYNLELKKIQLEEEVSESIRMYGEIQELNSTLETKVKNRTLELSKKNSEVIIERNNVSNILDNMLQAVFAVNKDGIIVAPISDYCTSIFEGPIIGKSVFDTLFKDIFKESMEYGQIKFGILSSIDVNSLQFICVEDKLPRKIKYINHQSEELTLRLTYSSIVNQADITTKILFVVEDISEIEHLEKVNEEKNEQNLIRIQRLQEIVSNKKEDIIQFGFECSKNIDLCKSSSRNLDIKTFSRGFHTIKGLARVYGLNDFARKVHELENELAKIKAFVIRNSELKDLLESLILKLIEHMKDYFNLADEVFDINSSEGIKNDKQYIEIPLKVFEATIDETTDFLKKAGNETLAIKLGDLSKVNFNLTCSMFLKMVKNIGNTLNKKIGLNVSGDQVYLEKEKELILKECLTHIIQNASDHGIKNKGIIKINLTKSDDSIKIAISDDGEGIDHRIIMKQALEKGLTSEEELENLTDQDILNFIFKPSFSTKESLSEYSGRGVGMDVVYTNVKKLNGDISISSKLNEGTQFTIKIPA